MTVTILVMADQAQSPPKSPQVAAALFLGGVLLLAAWNINLPYLAFSPGPITDAADVIEVEGAETFQPDGELLMLTVVSQEVNIFEALIAGIDPSIDLVREQAYRQPHESDESYRRRLLAQMDDSQRRSIELAVTYLGYELIPTELVVVDLIEGLPAESVLEIGDRIVTFNGVSVASLTDLTDQLAALVPGNEVEMTISREGVKTDLRLELGEKPEEPGAPMIGVNLHQLSDPPFPVEIDTGATGGPSAGLMHTLAIIELLTPGDIGKGHVIAGTGVINRDGTVGSIGGVRQKVVAAEAAGAAYMLVPSANYESALTAPRDGLELVQVGSLEEALSFLESLPDL